VSLKQFRFITSAFALFFVVSAWPGPAAAGPEPTPQHEIVSDDGMSTVSIHLWTQMLVQHEQTGLWTDEPDDGDTRLRFRRIRPVLRGKLMSERLSYVLHLSTAPGSLEFMDWFIDYKRSTELSLRVGQQKIPFTRHRMNSFRDRPVVDWSWPTRYFGAERQYGIMAHNGAGKPARLEYEVGVFSGVNARASNGVGMALAYADEITNPSNLVDPAPAVEVHPEVAAHVAFNEGGINVRRPSDLEGGGLRYSLGLSAAWDARPTDRQDTTLRVAPEFLVQLHGWAAAGVAYAGVCQEVTGSEAHELCLAGGLFSLGRVFRDDYEIAVRYGGVFLLGALRDDARQYADEQIGSVTDPDEAAALVALYSDVGYLRAEHEVGTGLTVYLFGTAVKWQTDVALLVHDRTDDDRYDVRGRTQLQLAY